MVLSSVLSKSNILCLSEYQIFYDGSEGPLMIRVRLQIKAGNVIIITVVFILFTVLETYHVCGRKEGGK